MLVSHHELHGRYLNVQINRVNAGGEEEEEELFPDSTLETSGCHAIIRFLRQQKIKNDDDNSFHSRIPEQDPLGDVSSSASSCRGAVLRLRRPLTGCASEPPLKMEVVQHREGDEGRLFTDVG